MQNKIAAIPWSSEKEWTDICSSIRQVDMATSRVTRAGVEIIRSLSAAIRHTYEDLSPLFERLCSETCPRCKENCCRRATIWYDQKDLLFSYWGLGSFPVAQIMKTEGGLKARACCHLSEGGCCLKRPERPFVCTWYVCPAQKALLETAYPGEKQVIDSGLTAIKRFRNKMAQTFAHLSVNPETDVIYYRSFLN